MNERQISQWRTVGVVVGACITLALVYGVSIWRAGMPLDLDRAARLFEHLTNATVWLIGALVLKRVGEAAAGGGGFKGMAKALMTDAKPGDPKP